MSANLGKRELIAAMAAMAAVMVLGPADDGQINEHANVTLSGASEVPPLLGRRCPAAQRLRSIPIAVSS
jgi:hypothetical protein